MGKARRALLALLVPLLLSGCGKYRPYEYVEPTDIPPGPGLLTGEDGEFVIYRKPRADPEKPEATTSP